MKKNNWINLGWEGQKLYLPNYTKLFRNTEKIIVDFLESVDFKECLFPKLITSYQSNDLKKALPRLSHEWSKELVDAKLENTSHNYPEKFVLPHWQCEPFYLFLQLEKPRSPIKFFDRSGWSYRVENDINDFRLFEFQRIECVWACPENKAIEIQDALLTNLSKLLLNLGIDNRIIEKKCEEIETSEKVVKDIETELDGIGNVELVGSHLHGRLFIDGLNIDIPDNYYTGCCGIGLNRIINCLIYLDEHQH